MQVENIFNNLTIQKYYFFNLWKSVKLDLFIYLYSNLYNVNNNFLQDLKTELRINANGKYI
jgi:hypothetical protein